MPMKNNNLESNQETLIFEMQKVFLYHVDT